MENIANKHFVHRLWLRLSRYELIRENLGAYGSRTITHIL